VLWNDWFCLSDANQMIIYGRPSQVKAIRLVFERSVGRRLAKGGRIVSQKRYRRELGRLEPIPEGRLVITKPII